MKLFRILLICSPLYLLSACNSHSNLFNEVSSAHSGITFNNKIIENDSVNPLSLVNVYNGGGVGIGDFNNDGLEDIYFTGNMVSSKLYLNKADFKFEDITLKAGVAGLERWARGVAIVDINNDGLTDIYTCNTIYKDTLRCTNILYLNQGLDDNGIPHFKDLAAEYGLNIGVQSTMANFFDYDNDGDLDMYLTVNGATAVNENKFGKSNNNHSNSKGSKGRLYRNDWDTILKHPVFRDMSQQAGITLDGFGHGATVADINRDGWKDIYVSNDFLSDNILYINNHNGTFTNHSKEYFKHTSFNAMGQDIIDINNDGLSDVVELDMNPRDNYRKKMMLGSNNYNTIQNFEMYGNQYQYVRNTLQLNQGPPILENDSVGAPVFSEIGFMSGISQTDWSWTPLVIDFDNDGFRDMIVTNGFPRDVTDHDFIAYRERTVLGESPMQLLDKIPEIKLANYAFKNYDGTTFADVTNTWGLTTPGFSNGAAYADFDNDGDMDLVINNINDEAFLYENSFRKKAGDTSHFLQIKCVGDDNNIHGIGAWIDIYYEGIKHQAYENTPYRGYLSTDQNIAHFGLGNTTVLDSVVIRWPGGKKETITKVSSDQLLKVTIKDARETYSWNPEISTGKQLFKEITKAVAINYIHRDKNFIDFNVQTTLPHKLSEYCPALAAGDIDGDGYDDIAIGGNAYSSSKLLLQQPGGNFIQRELTNTNDSDKQLSKDEGLLLFDANGDGSLDLYVASGGYQYEHGSLHYEDRLYLNDGKGNFTRTEAALPLNHTSKLCVKAADFNNDGKPDLFVSGRVDPWNYPKPVSSFIFRNDSENGKVIFTDVTAQLAPDLLNIGMVCDALFSDFDNDNRVDLVLAGEWMPITFLKNTGEKFTNVSAATGIGNQAGWWTSIVAGDFRHTGRTDYIIGNVGLNTLYQASDAQPVFITAKDFDHNGGFVPVPSLFLPAKDGKMKEFPAYGRDDIIERIPTLKKRFDNYKKFADVTMEEIFPAALSKDALRLKATLLQSCYLRNEGNGKFTIIPLPAAAQASVVNGMIADDFDGDGNLDLLINGNDFGTEVSIGRMDAANGLLLKGDGRGGFTPLSMMQSGIYIPGDGKALIRLPGTKGNYLVAASQNRGPLKLFELRKVKQFLKLQADDVYATIHLKNGAARKEEFYYGAGFLSQSTRHCVIDDNVVRVEITGKNGAVRKIDLKK